MEHMEEDMNMVMDNQHKTNFSDVHFIKLVYNSLLAIAFLHEANVLHRDLKPANMLINGNCDVKICDFGMSRTLPA